MYILWLWLSFLSLFSLEGSIYKKRMHLLFDHSMEVFYSKKPKQTLPSPHQWILE